MPANEHGVNNRYKRGLNKNDKVKYPSFAALVEAGKIDEAIEKLTAKQKKFVIEYLVDFNATQAVLRAGFDTNHANKIGSQLLDHPGIRAAIDKLTTERADKSPIKPEYVLKKVQRTIEKAEGEGNHTAVLRGCELLARHLGMFIERTEISGPNGDAIKYERVQEAADAFTSAISSLIERSRTSEGPIDIELGDPS